MLLYKHSVNKHTIVQACLCYHIQACRCYYTSYATSFKYICYHICKCVIKLLCSPVSVLSYYYVLIHVSVLSSCYYVVLKKCINNSRGKYKRSECLINVCKSDKDLS